MSREHWCNITVEEGDLQGVTVWESVPSRRMQEVKVWRQDGLVTQGPDEGQNGWEKE